MSINIKPTYRYTVFKIYDNKSHYSSTNNVLWKKHVREKKRIYLVPCQKVYKSKGPRSKGLQKSDVRNKIV